MEYLENLNEIGKTEPTGSLRRRSRKHRTSTLPRNIRSSMTSPSNGVLGVEGLRLKYESIGDRIINTRNYGQILLEQMEIWQSSFFKARNFIKDLRQSGTISIFHIPKMRVRDIVYYSFFKIKFYDPSMSHTV